MEKFMIIGTVETISEAKQSKNGKTYFEIKAYTEQSFNGKEIKKTFPMTYFGKNSSLLKQGDKCFLEGNLNMYNGQITLNLQNFSFLSMQKEEKKQDEFTAENMPIDF